MDVNPFERRLSALHGPISGSVPVLYLITVSDDIITELYAGMVL